MIKADWWSETVSGGLASIGITRDVRDSLQPTVDQAVSLLPKGGAVPAPTSNLGSIPQATGFSFQSSNSKMLMIGVVVAAIILALLMRRK